MKKYISPLIMFGLTLTVTFGNALFTTENGKLSVVITCKDPIRGTPGPDAGSQVFLLGEVEAAKTKYGNIQGTLAGFRMAGENLNLTINNTIDPGIVRDAQDLFDTIAIKTGRYLQGYKQLPGVIRIVTDEDGRVSAELRPGRYVALVVSGSLKSSNAAEFRGAVEFRTVEVKPVGVAVMKIYFEHHDLTGIMRITAWQRAGC